MANELTDKYRGLGVIRRPRAYGRFCLFFISFLALLASGPLFADEAREKMFAQSAQAAFDQAQIQFQTHTNDPVAAWEFARTCYDWADWATNKSQRAEIAHDGIAACHHSLALTNSVAAHYYLAMNLGQLAQSETLGALKVVRGMEREFSSAADLDAHFDFAGPERNLGLLYRDAPGWPMSIGNRQKAREFLESAVAIAPAYPENILNLGESYLKWGELPYAKKELDALDALWPRAQQNLKGREWEQSWDDWSIRRAAFQRTLKHQ
jgi:hypothetical protein